MNKKYKVVFEECSGFHAGDIVTGAQVATSEFGLTYLLSVGAIEFVESPSTDEIAAEGVKKLTKAAQAAKDAAEQSAATETAEQGA